MLCPASLGLTDSLAASMMKLAGHDRKTSEYRETAAKPLKTLSKRFLWQDEELPYPHQKNALDGF